MSQAQGLDALGPVVEDKLVLTVLFDLKFLTGCGQHQPVDREREADGCGILAEVRQKLIIAAASDEGLPASEGITGKDQPRVIFTGGQQPGLKRDIGVNSVNFEDLVDLLQSVECLCNLGVGSTSIRQVSPVFRTIVNPCHRVKELRQVDRDGLLFQVLLQSEAIVIFNQTLDPLAVVIVKAAGIHKTGKKIGVRHRDLKVQKANSLHPADDKGNHLGIRVDGRIPDQLSPKLRALLKMPLIGRIVIEDIALIREAYGPVLLCEIFRGGPGNGGSDIRPENQGIPLPVIELVPGFRVGSTPL